MTPRLLAIAVGPVQELIAAARRTRDLWFGSHLLSEISKAVARAVQSQRGELIFPAPSSEDDLAPNSALNVANVVLAQLPAGADPGTIAGAARRAAQDRWAEFADEAHRSVAGALRDDVWSEQIADIVELYAAWTPLGGDYSSARKRVMRLLNGRKSGRDFLAAKGHAGLPKSSLDGARETVLKERADWPPRCRSLLRARDGEQLDAVGVVKRVAGGTTRYPSVSRVAADPWVRANRTKLGDVIDACAELRGNGVIRELNTADGHGHGQFEAFPYEGTAVYRMRHHELIEETDVGAEGLAPLVAALSRLPEPDPYLAVLVADGDRMGKAISGILTAETHQEFSRTLARFAGAARAIVERHHGVLVYSGGDDVLAFVPVDRCLGCARALRTDFTERLRAWGEPTLSVGIAIGHFLENLEDLLEYGRAAEKHAKEPDRDGLAVHVHKRGGAPIRWRAPWADKPDERLAEYAEYLLSRAIPGRLPYELRRLADLYQSWPPETVKDALRQDVLRVIQDKQPRGGRASLDQIAALMNERVKDAASLRQFAEELLIARRLAVAKNQAREHTPSPRQEAAR